MRNKVLKRTKNNGSVLPTLPLIGAGPAAQYLDISKGRLWQMIRQGAGPKNVRFGKLMKFRPEDLAAFVEQNSHSSADAKRA